MKKIFLLFLLLPLMRIYGGLPDSLFIDLHGWGQSMIGVDSLQTFGSTHYSDSVRYVSFKYLYTGIPQITVYDSGSVIADTIKLYKGRVQFNNANPPAIIDTLWDTFPLTVVKDDFTYDTLLTNSGFRKTYGIMDWNIDLLKIIRTNVDAIEDNVTEIIIEATRKQQ